MTKRMDMEISIYQQIKTAILKREYLPSDRLVEITIAEKLGVSRTPIREALKKLSYEGLVDIVHNTGAFVAQPSLEEMIQVFSCRMLIEKETTRLATREITSKAIAALEKIVARQDEIYGSSKDFEKFIESNNDFHMTIARYCNNKYYIRYIEELVNKSNLYLIYFDKFQSTNKEDSAALREHARLIDALKRKDAEESSCAMYDHIKTTYIGLTSGMLERMGPNQMPAVKII